MTKATCSKTNTSLTIYAPFLSHLGNDGWKSKNKWIINCLHNLGFNTHWSIEHAVDPQSKTDDVFAGLMELSYGVYCTVQDLDHKHVLVCVTEAEKVMMLNKGLLSADTNETKNSLTWKLKYKNSLQPECPLSIHIKWISVVWVQDSLNLQTKHIIAAWLLPQQSSSATKIRWKALQE